MVGVKGLHDDFTSALCGCGANNGSCGCRATEQAGWRLKGTHDKQTCGPAGPTLVMSARFVRSQQHKWVGRPSSERWTKKREKNKSRWMHENASTHMKPPVSSPQAPQHDITGARWRPWCRDILTLCVYDLEVNWTNQGPIQSGTCGTCHGPLSLHKTFKTSRNPAAFLAFTPQQTQLPLTHCASFPGRRT